MSPEGATPGSTCEASVFQEAAELAVVMVAVMGRTASPKHETAHAAPIRQSVQ